MFADFTHPQFLSGTFHHLRSQDINCPKASTSYAGVEIRAPGLALLLLGVVALAIPAYRHFIPPIPLSDFEWHLTGGLMLAASGLLLWLTRAA